MLHLSQYVTEVVILWLIPETTFANSMIRQNYSCPIRHNVTQVPIGVDIQCE